MLRGLRGRASARKASKPEAAAAEEEEDEEDMEEQEEEYMEEEEYWEEQEELLAIRHRADRRRRRDAEEQEDARAMRKDIEETEFMIAEHRKAMWLYDAREAQRLRTEEQEFKRWLLVQKPGRPVHVDDVVERDDIIGGLIQRAIKLETAKETRTMTSVAGVGGAGKGHQQLHMRKHNKYADRIDKKRGERD